MIISDTETVLVTKTISGNPKATPDKTGIKHQFGQLNPDSKSLIYHFCRRLSYHLPFADNIVLLDGEGGWFILERNKMVCHYIVCSILRYWGYPNHIGRGILTYTQNGLTMPICAQNKYKTPAKTKVQNRNVPHCKQNQTEMGPIKV